MIVLYMLAGIVVYLAITSIVRVYAEYKVERVMLAFKHYEKQVDKTFDSINKSLKQAELLGSVKERFKQFRKLTETQQDLINQVYTPSKSAAHSKFKNVLTKEIKDIENRKKDILKTILDDGIDVHMTVMDPEGKTSKMKISEILADRTPQVQKLDSKTDSKSPSNSVTKLRLVKENKDDPSNPEIH